MDSADMTASTDGLVELWLLPAPFDFVEDNWRAIRITFRPDASAEDAAPELFQLGRAFDSGLSELPVEGHDLGTCSIHFELDLDAEVAALLLYRAAYWVEANGMPTSAELLVLSDPDRTQAVSMTDAPPNLQVMGISVEAEEHGFEAGTSPAVLRRPHGNGEVERIAVLRDRLRELRQAVGEQIDPATAEVWFEYEQVMDPYGDDPNLPDECYCVGREWFARDPISRIAIHWSDLPETTCEQLEARRREADKEEWRRIIAMLSRA